MRLQYQLLDKVENTNKITNGKGVKYIEIYVAPLLTAYLFQFPYVCTDMHKQMR